jgi:putative Mg2+ transporter-C (MgtC) family protein
MTFGLRLLVGGFCGAVIGYERENRQKPAGVRTHAIVGVASALMMIISKYGFAAGIVTATGFLGSGIISSKSKGVSGLTTSAGLWATVGVGMAVGGGDIMLGVMATLIVLAIEILFGRVIYLHRSSGLLKRVSAEVTGGASEVETLKNKILAMGFKVRRFEFSKKESDKVSVVFYLVVTKGHSATELLGLREPWLTSLEVKD